MARSPIWADDVSASGAASRHQPMNWRDSIGFQTSVTQEAFPKREARSVSEHMKENLSQLCDTNLHHALSLPCGHCICSFCFASAVRIS